MSTAVASRSSSVSPVEARSSMRTEITTRARPMSRCFVIFIASASCPLEHHHVGRLSDNLERDCCFSVCVQDSDDIVQRPV